MTLSSFQSSISVAIQSGDAFAKTVLPFVVSILNRTKWPRVSSNTTTHPGNSDAPFYSPFYRLIQALNRTMQGRG